MVDGGLDEFLPDDADVQFEEELLRTPYSVKLWCRYLDFKRDASEQKRSILYERALRLLPGSYKLWHAYLHERHIATRGQPANHPSVERLTHTFERALATMHKMPVIWMQYLTILVKQKFITKCRRAFDRALTALPVMQHDRIWKVYLEFVHQPGIPDETAFRVYRRYLQYEPTHAEEFIEFLKAKERWGEAAKKLTEVLNDDEFRSVTGKSKHQLWLELSDILTRHPNAVRGMDVDGILRGGVRKFTDEVGRLWTSLADYYIRQGMFERARDIYEEGLSTVITVRDFGLIFDAFAAFEESLVNAKMKDTPSDELTAEGDDSDIDLWYGHIPVSGCGVLKLECRISRLEDLMGRRPVLLSSVMLRQNPHNVHEWHKRVKLYKGIPTKQILTYTEAVKTVSCQKAVGKLHSLWCAFAKFYEYHGDLKNARIIFSKATQAEFKYVDDLASVWCEWAEMELRHANFQRAIEVLKRATEKPFSMSKRMSREEQLQLPVKDRLYKNARVWSFYCDLEESLGTVETTRAVYDRILELRIATPQIILNYAHFLQEHKYFEDSYRIYERGIAIFKYPHVGDIWSDYIQHFIRRNGGKKVERVRDMFEEALQQAPAEFSRPLYLSYAKFEEDYGLAKHAMTIYEKAARTVPIDQRMHVYNMYLTKAMEFFGVGKVRDVYQSAIEAQPPSELSDEDCRKMFLRFAALERNLGEIDRGRAIYTQASYLADPSKDKEFWDEWNSFEIQHGNEDTFREMRRIMRSVAASFSQIHFNTATIEAVAPSLPGMEVTHESAIAALETEAVAEQEPEVFGKFVKGEVIQPESLPPPANPETIHLEDDDGNDVSEDEAVEKEIEVAEKDVPEAVFGGLKRKSTAQTASVSKKTRP